MACSIASILETLDRLKPNKYEDEDKIAWISQLEWKIKTELLDTHQTDAAFSGYDAASDRDAPLLIQGAHQDIYLKYLVCQIDFFHREAARYNDSAAAFNCAWIDLANHINRRYPPRGAHSVSIVL